MPIVPPDVHGGATRVLSAHLDNDLLLRTIAYSRLCNAGLSSVVRVALAQLLQADKAELDAYLASHPDELDHRKLRSFPVSRTRGDGSVPPASRKKKDKEPQTR
ncbi:MAG TPA: hypothetical protein VN461_20805 [Vicinamibacteria bacterium]|jgi:hypothetical protein|nr:hypothetical protein [Vicinamibacteria bacterium]